jgi:uncharacterized protein YfkK (UPF0435 family)
MMIQSLMKGGLSRMNLTTPSKENVAYIVEKIKEKLKMVNSEALRSEDFTEANYEDLYDLYEMVMKRDTFSPSEMQAIVSELGSLRK